MNKKLELNLVYLYSTKIFTKHQRVNLNRPRISPALTSVAHFTLIGFYTIEMMC